MTIDTQTDTNQRVLDDSEITRLALSLAKSRGDKGFEEAELLQLTDWATDAKVSYGLYQLVQDGLAEVDVVDGEPVFQLSDLGKEEPLESLRQA